MSTDRELLEAAAKAAGLDLSHPWNEEMRWPMLVFSQGDARLFPGLVVKVGGDTHDTGWNPISNDGDAFRLAVKLQISIEFGSCQDDAPVVWCSHEFGYRERSANFPDPLAATRRAIVRAAAALADHAEEEGEKP